MIHLLFSLFFIFINGQKLGKKEDIYEMLINEKVSQQYCNEVINNLTYMYIQILLKLQNNLLAMIIIFQKWI